MQKSAEINTEFYRETVEQVISDFEKRRRERLSLERQWELNVNFLTGNQYCDIYPDGEIRDMGKDYFWQSRKVYNHIAPLVEARVSRLSKVRPRMSVRAFSDEEADLKTAKITSNILNYASSKLNISKIVSKATDWSETCGTAFYKILWNAKRKFVDEGDNEGDVEVSVVSPFEIYPDSLTHEQVSDCKSIIHARAMHVDDIYALYGERVQGQPTPSIKLTNSRTFSYEEDERNEEYALVIEKFEKPSVAYPNGRVITVCGDKILYTGDLPYFNGVDGKRDFPFVKQCSLSVTGNFFGMSIIERMIPVQKAFNAVKNRKHELLNRISMGVIAVEDGAVDVDELSEDGLYPGKVLVYRQGATPPVMLNYGNVPNDFTYEEELLKNEFTAISGVSEFSRSSTAIENMTSGVALQLLVEQDDNRILCSIENVKEAMKEISKQIIRLYKQFAETKRVVRIAGKNKKVETYYFTKKDIGSDDVVFDTENDLSYTPAQKQNALYNLLSTGLLVGENGKMDKRTKTKILEIMGFGSMDNARDISSLHMDKAEKENLDILGGKQVQAEYIDDHKIHIDEHTAFLLSQELEGKGESIKQAMIAHIKEHRVLSETGESQEGGE